MKQTIAEIKSEIKSIDGQISYCHLAISRSSERWVIKEYIGVKFDCLRRKKYLIGVISRFENA